jgi:hypothetical protein
VSQEPRQGNDATAAAWHPDPSGRHDFRWFNGREWTADVADDGRRGFDPDVSPDPAPPTAHGRAAALTSITLAVIALAISWMPFVVVLGVAAAFSAIVLGVIGMARLRPGAGSGRSLAIAGIACGVAALGLSGIGVSSSRSLLDDFRSARDPGAHDVQVVSCVIDAEGRAVAIGEISNRDARPRTYVVTVTFGDSSGEFADRSARVPVVDPGESVRFEVTTSAGGTSSAELACRIDRVNSPSIVLGSG